MNTMALRSALGLLVGGCLLGAVTTTGCADRKATSMVVAVSSEIAVPDEVDHLEIHVSSLGAAKFDRTYLLGQNGDASLPGTLVISPEDETDPSTPVKVTVVAKYHDTRIRVLREAVLAFSDEKQRLLRMPLRFSCLDFEEICQEGNTCRGGECVPSTIDASALPEFEPTQVFAEESSCFDRAACIPKDLTEDMTDYLRSQAASGRCSFSLDELRAEIDAHHTNDATGSTRPSIDKDAFNLGYVWSKNASAKWTAVDMDHEEGWHLETVDGATHIELAPGMCKALNATYVDETGAVRPKVAKVIMNPACPPKAPTQPECPVK
ncbi:MAG: hypothetical protein U0165_13260 [Polyangiaceae bacterium]